MKVLILGSTGMLGQALIKEADKREIDVIGASKSSSGFRINIQDDYELIKKIKEINPDIIINAVALVNLETCENNPGLAYEINTRPLGLLANLSSSLGIYLVQISTDHYYTGDKNLTHSVNSPVCLINEYARTKYAAEGLTLTAQNSLVVRTNIVGFRNRAGNPTFMEWLLESIKGKTSITLFEDFFTSSISTTQFSRALFDLIQKRPNGVLNLASREVFNKKRFIESISDVFHYPLEDAKVGSVRLLKGVLRAESLGLDVDYTERILGYKLPTLYEVAESLKEDYRGAGFYEL